MFALISFLSLLCLNYLRMSEEQEQQTPSVLEVAAQKTNKTKTQKESATFSKRYFPRLKITYFEIHSVLQQILDFSTHLSSSVVTRGDFPEK